MWWSSMRTMLTNIFRIFTHKLDYFTLGTVKKMNEWMNQSINQLGGEGHRKHGMYESLLRKGWCLLTPSSEVITTKQVLSNSRTYNPFKYSSVNEWHHYIIAHTTHLFPFKWVCFYSIWTRFEQDTSSSLIFPSFYWAFLIEKK